MSHTVLITGSSSGIGKAAALFFAQKGWNVAATMRSPEKETELNKIPNIKLFTLDVTKPETIQEAIQSIIQTFGPIDVLVNNAGYGAVGPFEAATPAEIEKEFQTNVFGVMNVTREILPHFRVKKSGTIINITSMGGRVTFPLYSVYHASKYAIEGFSESLQFELEPYGIKVKLVEPGVIKTDFYSRSLNVFQKPELTAYDAYTNPMLAGFKKMGSQGTDPAIVAETIYKAATDPSATMRYVVGKNAHLAITSHALLPNWLYRAIMQRAVRM